MATKKDYDTSVFINCPFDSQYKTILDAITFAVHDSGYLARSALEEVNTASERNGKIIKIIRESKYGIHDISRIEIDKTSKLPRLNMPYELGLFYGAQAFGDANQKKKQILVLDSEKFRYQRTLSDIAGKDAAEHGNDPLLAIAAVRKFLTNKERGNLRGATEIQRRYQAFLAELPTIAKLLVCTVAELQSFDYWNDYTFAMADWCSTHP